MKCNLIKWDAFGNYEVLEYLQSYEICLSKRQIYEEENPLNKSAWYQLEIVMNVREF